MDIDWTKVRVREAKGLSGCVITHGEYGGYLHYDGTWQQSCWNDQNVFTGLYYGSKGALEIMEKYRPVVRLKDVKPGQVFKIHMFGNGYAKMLDSSDAEKYIESKHYLTVDIDKPDMVRLISKDWANKEVEIKPSA